MGKNKKKEQAQKCLSYLAGNTKKEKRENENWNIFHLPKRNRNKEYTGLTSQSPKTSIIYPWTIIKLDKNTRFPTNYYSIICDNTLKGVILEYLVKKKV